MSYKKLEIWQWSRILVIQVYKLSMQELPLHERYALGSQLRRAITSVKANIVEGYGRRRYKNDFIRHLTYAHASLDESIDHIETLLDTGLIKPTDMNQHLLESLNILGRKLNQFIQSVERAHNATK